MRRVLGLVAVALALLGGAGCSRYPAAPDFTLTDQHGALWTLSAQHGKAVALYFGFTHCPDTCPATVAKLAKAIGENGNAEIAFVTVDPQRDTPPVLDAFAQRFSGAPIIGLTGSPKQIASVERAYHIWAQKIPGKHGNYDYDEAHISIVTFIDANGRERGIADQDESVTTLASDIRSARQ
ncbi:MAG: SCO family protein [Candidatus Eremiobacteraeota bacterium]|nr:SCO family protein [Candidatus Eremiobacteraeota bacterium]